MKEEALRRLVAFELLRRPWVDRVGRRRGVQRIGDAIGSLPPLTWGDYGGRDISSWARVFDAADAAEVARVHEVQCGAVLIDAVLGVSMVGREESMMAPLGVPSDAYSLEELIEASGRYSSSWPDVELCRLIGLFVLSGEQATCVGKGPWLRSKSHYWRTLIEVCRQVSPQLDWTSIGLGSSGAIVCRSGELLSDCWERLDTGTDRAHLGVVRRVLEILSYA